MNGIDLIAAERRRQISVEEWTPEHDAQHTQGELANAACCYADLASEQEGRPSSWPVVKLPTELPDVPERWPWDGGWWKPSPDPVRNLAKAGALIAAEIDRITAAKEATK